MKLTRLIPAFAVAATLTGLFSWTGVAREFAWIALGGLGVGAALGWGFARIRTAVTRRVGDVAATQMVLLLVLLTVLEVLELLQLVSLQLLLLVLLLDLLLDLRSSTDIGIFWVLPFCKQLYAEWGIQQPDVNCEYLTTALQVVCGTERKLAVRKEIEEAARKKALEDAANQASETGRQHGLSAAGVDALRVAIMGQL